jgi:hypothetical protein
MFSSGRNLTNKRNENELNENELNENELIQGKPGNVYD